MRIFHKECHALVRAGHDVTVVAPHHRDETVAGVRVRGVRGSRDDRLGRVSVTMWRIYREALELGAAAYHLHDPELLPLGLLLRRRGRHVVYDVHEDLPRTIDSKPYVPAPLRAPLAALSGRVELAATRHLSAVVAATPSIAERFAVANPCTVVVRNYVVMSEWRSGCEVPWSARAPVVAYVGGVTWDRGLREMVEAMALLRGRAEARLVIAGPYSPPSLRAEAERLAGWSRVEDLGVLGRQAIAELLGRVRVGIVILQPTAGYVRSLPIKLFEYMAAGLPVVVSDFPQLRAIVEDAGCGILVDPQRPAAVADAIEFLLTHARDAEMMGSRGRAAVAARYNWITEERTLQALYRVLAEQAA